MHAAAGRAQLQRERENRQMGSTLSRGWPGRTCRSQLAPDVFFLSGKGFASASPALDRLPDCRDGRTEPSHHQPILRRNRLSGIRNLEPQPAVQRYEYEAPGDLLHLDIKKLGRFSAPGARAHGDLSRRTRGLGWNYMHVAIDDHCCVAFSRIHASEPGSAVTAFCARPWPTTPGSASASAGF